MARTPTVVRSPWSVARSPKRIQSRSRGLGERRGDVPKTIDFHPDGASDSVVFGPRTTDDGSFHSETGDERIVIGGGGTEQRTGVDVVDPQHFERIARVEDV